MGAAFLKILNMSMTASWMILAVIAARKLLKTAPRWISCLLWGMVAIRLVCPVSFESIFSLVPSSEPIPAGIAFQASPSVNTGISIVNDVVNPALSASFTPGPGDSANPLQIVIPIAAAIWITGILILSAYAVISSMKLKKTVAVCLPAGGNVFACDEINTPFILGVFRPRIYVPSSMKGETLEQVLLHENAHLQRHDHWWKPLGFLLVSIYWFNPLCWIAYVLLCRDIEMACDEKVIREMDVPARAAYSQAILDCSFSRRRIAACPLAFGEVGVKERVRGVLHYRRPTFWLILAAVIICLAVAICFLTNPKSEEQDIPVQNDSNLHVEVPTESTGVSDIVQNRTDYIGDAPAVVRIAEDLPYPGNYTYDHIEIQSDHEPYELTVYLIGTDAIEQSEFDEAAELAIEQSGFEKASELAIGQSGFDDAAELAFDQIGNMGVIRFCRQDNGEVIAEFCKQDNGEVIAAFYRPAQAGSDVQAQMNDNEPAASQENNGGSSEDDLSAADGENQTGVLVPYEQTEDGQWEASTKEQNAEGAEVELAEETGTEGGSWLWPLEKTHEIADSFGTRVHPFTGEERTHDHVNLRAEDDERVVAAVGGTIKDIQYDPQMGNMVTVDVGNGIEIEYGHLAKVGVTEVGKSINTGDVIGTAGTTGMATGTNLSFKVTVDGEPVDPLQFLGE